MSVFMGPGGHVVCYFLRAGALLNFVGLVETAEVSEEAWTVKFPWDALKTDFTGWHPIIQTIIDSADRDQCYRWSLHNRPPLAQWSSGRVTLLGDSAHATLPYLAQGAVMALEDGAVLTRALAMTDGSRTRYGFMSATGSPAPRASSPSRAPTAPSFTCGRSTT
jgi:salicylate hydroxylase